jgi:ribosome-associated translation inhibitor RaiA
MTGLADAGVSIMQIPIEITFRNMQTSSGLEASIRDWAQRLDHALPIQRCTVVVEMPHKHRKHGTPFQVHVTVSIPGHDVAITRGDRAEYQDPYLAVADAFRAARRQLLDFIAQRREARPAP